MSLLKLYESSKLEAQENYFSYLRTVKWVQDNYIPAWYFIPSETITSITEVQLHELDVNELESNNDITVNQNTVITGYSITIGDYLWSDKYAYTLETSKLYRLLIIGTKTSGIKKSFYSEIFKKLG